VRGSGPRSVPSGEEASIFFFVVAAFLSASRPGSGSVGVGAQAPNLPYENFPSCFFFPRACSSFHRLDLFFFRCDMMPDTKLDRPFIKRAVIEHFIGRTLNDGVPTPIFSLEGALTCEVPLIFLAPFLPSWTFFFLIS